MNKRLIAVALASMTGLVSMAVYAEEDYPKNVVKIGAYRFFVNDKSGDLTGPPGFTPPGVQTRVADANTFALTYSRFITPNLDLQLAAGIPPKFKFYGKGTMKNLNPPLNTLSPQDLGQIGSAVALFPTFLANYHFGSHKDTWRPYVGAGFNYTAFVKERSSSSLNSVLGQTDIKLKSSLGAAVTAGLDYKLSNDWSISVSATYLKAKTTATLTSPSPLGGTVTRVVSVKLDPFVGLISAAYAF